MYTKLLTAKFFTRKIGSGMPHRWQLGPRLDYRIIHPRYRHKFILSPSPENINLIPIFKKDTMSFWMNKADSLSLSGDQEILISSYT